MFRLLIVLAVCLASPVVAEEQTFEPEALQADFEQLYIGLLDAQYDPFHQVAPSELASAYRQYLSQLDRPMTLRQASALFQQFTALTKTAHTRVEFPIELYRAHLADGGKTLPIYLNISEEAVLVDEYYGAEPLSQTQIISVDGRPVHEWLEPYRELISADNDRLLNVMLGMQMPGMIWWHEGEQPSYTFEVLNANGDLVELVVSTTTFDRQVLFYDDDSDEPLRSFDVLNERYGYLKPGPFYNAEGENPWDAGNFKEWIDQAFESFNALATEVVVVDLRNNPGGTNSFSDHMIAWFADESFKFASDFKVKVSEQAASANRDRLELSTDETDVSYRYQVFFDEHENGEVFSFPLDSAEPLNDRHYDGEVVVLVDRFSFSNAVSVAAIVQDYGFGVVVGEETADLATTYGAMEHFTLTNTGLVVGFPKALIIRPNGDENPAGVVPDVVFDTDGDVLEQVMEWLDGR